MRERDFAAGTKSQVSMLCNGFKLNLLRNEFVECGGPPPLWNTTPLANQNDHGSFAGAVFLRELRTARQ